MTVQQPAVQRPVTVQQQPDALALTVQPPVTVQPQPVTVPAAQIEDFFTLVEARSGNSKWKCNG
eukprot:COSAG05_NODE_13958_length_413_cov_0.595541_2_plen_63_part_01